MRRFAHTAAAFLMAIAAAVAATVAVLGLLVPNLVPTFTPFVVETSSMADYRRGTAPLGMDVGTLVVVDSSVAPQHVELGDAITFVDGVGDATKPLTHVVVAVGVDHNGATTWTTQGASNDAPDEMPVSADRLLGRAVYAIPLVGYIAAWPEWTFWAGSGLAILVLIIIPATVGALKRRAARRRLPEVSHAEHTTNVTNSPEPVQEDDPAALMVSGGPHGR